MKQTTVEMERTQLVYFFLLIFHSFFVCNSENICRQITDYRGEVAVSTSHHTDRCWTIIVPANNYARLNITQLYIQNKLCSDTYLKIITTDDSFRFCYQDSYRKPILSLSDISITLYHNSGFFSSPGVSFKIHYTIENLLCVHKSHFRCSKHFCIRKNQICDGVDDCENGEDELGCDRGISIVQGVNSSRENAIIWLRKERSASFGWGRNTHRAITALYLSGNATFRGHNLDEELIAKQLELQTSVALLRNSTDVLSVNDLSMFINALSVTCHNPRKFYGYDLLKILAQNVAISNLTNPGAHLTLCNANWMFSQNQVQNLLHILQEESDYPFHLDVQAMTILALSCIKNKTQAFDTIQNATEIYNATIEQFISDQLPDGSFGNVYTTALVTQALIASGHEDSKLWKLNSTIEFLMEELNFSSDFLSVYLSLPVFNSKSLVDIGHMNCTNPRKHDGDISDVTNKLGGKIRVQYSLFVGDMKDVTHTVHLRMPENSSAYDVMKIAETIDIKYKFIHRSVSGKMYVYEIAGITNDPEAGKFWLLYTGGLRMNSTIKHHTKSPDKFIVKDGEHLIMWFKTANI